MSQPDATTDENPYAVSLTCQGDVDTRRPVFGREHLAQLIRNYLAGVSSAEQFRKAISPYDDDEPDDKSTTWAAEQMGMLIYENSDDPATWPKQGWNFAQRILLLLDSGYVISHTSKLRWTWLQIPALVTLLVLIYGIVMFDWIGVFWFIAGLCSMLVGRFRSELAELQEQPFDAALSPFGTIASVEDAMRRAPEFRKTRWTASEMTSVEQPNLSRFRPAALFGTAILTIFWIQLAPLVLLFQCVPIHTTHKFAVPPDSSEHKA